MLSNQDIVRIGADFCPGVEPIGIRELTAGNVNATYRLDYDAADRSRSLVLQRINTEAFRDPDALMENIRLVTEHIRAALVAAGTDPARRVLEFLPAADGGLLHREPDGSCWRCYRFVDGVTAYDRIESPALFREAGRGFGAFQTMLADFPADRLSETIPFFHDTPRRYEAFRASVAADAAGCVGALAEEIAFFDSRAGKMHGIVDRMASGELPLRVTHNDTKLNNVLIDNETHRALCVIDLDTVMPGSVLYDFGDAVRYGACTAAEDEPDTTRIGFDMELFRVFAEGFLSETAGRLTDAELTLLPLGAEVITCELAMRFLTDYIDGDRYFKIRYPEHNLVRARAQMKLLTEIEAHRDEMDACIEAWRSAGCGREAGSRNA